MKHVAGLVLSLGIALAPSMLRAQDAWPARSITFVVPYGAGGYTDLVGRLTARYVEKALGKPVVIDIRAGAGGIVGTQVVATSVPDGYTFCVCSIGAISIASFAQKIPYDPVQDLAPVGIVSSIVQAVIVRKDLPVKSMAELVSYAKANPGKLNYGSQGIGTTSHLTTELFMSLTGTKMVHVPYKGTAPALNDLIAGQVDFIFMELSSAVRLHQGGNARILAVATDKRLDSLRDIPTMNEAGVPNFVSDTWNALSAPPKTPAPIINKLNQAVNEIVAAPETKKQFEELSLLPAGGSPAEMAKFVKDETRRWTEVIRRAGIQPE